MSDETVTIEVYGTAYTLTKLQRHVLYCANDGRIPSARLYSADEINAAYEYLEKANLVFPSGGATTLGDELVEACKARPRA